MVLVFSAEPYKVIVNPNSIGETVRVTKLWARPTTGIQASRRQNTLQKQSHQSGLFRTHFLHTLLFLFFALKMHPKKMKKQI
jgi:hypothetical protein